MDQREYNIRVFVYDHLIFEITETDHVYFILKDRGLLIMQVWLGHIDDVKIERLHAIVNAIRV